MMFATSTVIFTILIYMVLLFMVAQWAEHRAETTGRANHPLIYALSFNVYSTSWAFYGAVGFAVSAGWMFTAFDSGAVAGMVFAGFLLRKMIRLKEAFRLTSIADLLSTRYNRSQRVAVVVTLVFLTGIVPYIALQLKVVVTTFSLLTSGQTSVIDWGGTGMMVVVLMIVFTVIFGVRHLDPTERHQGMMTALALESLVKLVALLTIGVFVTFVLHDGVSDLFARLPQEDRQRLLSFNVDAPALLWPTNFILGLAAIYLLPRQFHIGVVENAAENHLPWLLILTPVYLLLIKLFVLPLAGAGLVMGLPASEADSFVLLIPMQTGNSGLALLVFIGGFSAATAMIIVSTMTLSTMATNHLLLPLLERFRILTPLRRHLLQCRWMAVVLILLGSYAFTWGLAGSQMLVALGSLSFVAIIQLAPATLGGLYWGKGSRAGAMLGLAAGLIIWAYTLLVPILVQQGWLPVALLDDGPGGISWLRPQSLFGLDGLPGVSHSLLWSLSVNCCGYLLGSLYLRAGSAERALALQFVKIQMHYPLTVGARPTGLRETIDLAPKLNEARGLLTCYLKPDKAEQLLEHIIEDLQIENKHQLSMMELVEFHWLVEKVLAGSIGAAAAHKALEKRINYSEREADELKRVHGHILAELQCLPESNGSAKQTTLRYRKSGHGQRGRQIEEQRTVIQGLQQTVDDLESRLEQMIEKEFERRLEIQNLKAQKRELSRKLADMQDQLERDEWRNKSGKQ